MSNGRKKILQVKEKYNKIEKEKMSMGNKIRQENKK